MAVVHADDFSIYGTNAALMLNGVYAQSDNAALTSDPDGVDPGYVLSNLAFGGLATRFVYPNTGTVTGLAFRLWQASLPSNTGAAQGHGALGSSYPAVFFTDSGNNVVLEVGIGTTGRISLRGHVSGNPDIPTEFHMESTNPAVAANGWYHIEIKVVTGSTPTIEVRVEGVTVNGLSIPPAAYSVINTIEQVIIGIDAFGTGAVLTAYKDLVIWDGTGSYNNDFMGSVLVKHLVTDSDVSLNWAPSTGADGYSILSSIPPVDTNYISAGIAPIPAAYVGTLSDLPANITTVRAVVTYVRAAKADGGDGSLQVGLISSPSSGPATVLGANRPITVAQSYWRDVFEVDPKTGAPWLPAAVDAAEIQINRTT